MIQQHAFQAIADLDLEPIKVKLMHRESGEGWSLDQANAVEFEYRRFLYLMKQFPHEATAPRQDVDIFWHYHILDTLKYAQDCERVFGYFLHHFPYIGLRGEEDELAHHRVGQRMKELYESTFETPYPGAGRDAFSGAAVQTAFSGAAVATAFSGAAVGTAFSGAAIDSLSHASTAARFYSERPHLR
ncbi:glycine-rich domain-containing protein-like [Massilia sp. TS11]|uniref:glycine-rich domain-containing protein n=1 Tax=Massilia sp. TS11 TaxID=2908003 RepID=UPI001EDB2B2A|nr:glycine-rich domain-containing protein-like [Massilia sp. TS11]MCG2585716.1 glycine-rich domain-containing protein-like [Massilia sp. TS11]